jgi:hypothetical protein
VPTSERPTVDYWRQYQDAINAIARFTAVDGATIIRSDLSVHAFGAFVRGSELDSDTTGGVVFKDLFEGGEERSGAIREVGGSRHQSAARFCLAVPGAIAIIASQDGSLCFMTRPEANNTVWVWGGIEFLLHGTWY